MLYIGHFASAISLMMRVNSWSLTPPDVGAAEASSAIAIPINKVKKLATAHFRRNKLDVKSKDNLITSVEYIPPRPY